MNPPAFFSRVRDRAALRWEQLENDSELAAPWHQLFKQVQNPRHALSELLQNADDAGATEASVRVVDSTFVFEHNGRDFTEQDFESLCRFGFSNKRLLHTIGFRGIGFKSIFSLGDKVHLSTPTLHLSFHRSKFTLPIWEDGGGAREHTTITRISVNIQGARRSQEVDKSLAEWSENAVSFLFFNSIRRVNISGRDFHWRSLGSGPVTSSEWFTLDDNADSIFLHAKSAAEPFPAESLEEIAQERMVPEGDLELPPSRVDIVLGARGELFVVLPTGVKTSLPFAANAPFVQDPARLGIKDPEVSPTNRWLLTRLGEFAASMTLEWLGDASVGNRDRSKAYNLLPGPVDAELRPTEANAATILCAALDAAMRDVLYVLTDDGNLVASGGAARLPEQIQQIWSASDAVALFDPEKRPLLCTFISRQDAAKLVARGAVFQVTTDSVVAVLREKPVPKPDGWETLLALWKFVAEQRHRNIYVAKHLHIVPVQGSDRLHVSQDVVRLGEARLLQSAADWEFLSSYLVVLNQNWTRFLAERRRQAADGELPIADNLEDMFQLLKDLGLDATSDINRVFEQVAAKFFSEAQVLETCVRIAQIAAKLNVGVTNHFRFITADDKQSSPDRVVISDQRGAAADLLPRDWCRGHVLHEKYTTTYVSCSSEEWQEWARSDRSLLHTFAPPSRYVREFWSRSSFEAELRAHGCHEAPVYPFKTDNFNLVDWDFEQHHWTHWQHLAAQDQTVYGRVMDQILAQDSRFWKGILACPAYQISQQSTKREVIEKSLSPSWILKFRELPCLRDTRGGYQKPPDLMRRTDQTEAFLDVEPFVHKTLDNESNTHLLDLLGVQNSPTAPTNILSRLRALSMSDQAPGAEVDKWYRKLDSITVHCSTEDLFQIRQAFNTEKLVLSESSGWTTASGAFRSADEDDVPGAAIVRRTVSDLALWTKVGVAERPTIELAMQWLMQIRPNQRMATDDIRRVQRLSGRHAAKVWLECGHWLNLLGEWIPVPKLRWAVTMSSLTSWAELHEWIKRETADFRFLAREDFGQPPLSALPPLASMITYEIQQATHVAGNTGGESWMGLFGSILSRVEFDNEPETYRVRALAEQLMKSKLQKVSELHVLPYVEGTPAGPASHADALWTANVLYVPDKPSPKLARIVSAELDRVFRNHDIADAIKTCYDRSAEFIASYLEDNFRLAREPSQRRAENAPDSTRPDDGKNVDNEDASLSCPPDDPASAEGRPVQSERHTIEDQRKHRAPEPQAPLPQPDPEGPAMIERLAALRGFKRVSENVYAHADGRALSRDPEGIFPWIERSASGQAIMHYWPRDHRLERRPLHINAEMWDMMRLMPDTTALVLSGKQGEPKIYGASEILGMSQDGRVQLSPATYRIVYKPSR